LAVLRAYILIREPMWTELSSKVCVISSSGGWTSGEAKQITGEDFAQIDF